ncbi:hypothetical protein DPMN_129486 [Dreissena polymorpha]|uniref:Uncharacterized protein n=1 Tax=Dreissena polymorpha TaxID=45954 RepID=A0A9D4H4S7_DREPO|nr:hypothetical protein DPMN_129486 [Dreissena polymorpha]
MLYRLSDKRALQSAFPVPPRRVRRQVTTHNSKVHRKAPQHQADQSIQSMSHTKPGSQTRTHTSSQSNPGSQFSTHTLSQSNPGPQFSTHTLSQSNPGSQFSTHTLTQSKPGSQFSTHILSQSHPGPQFSTHTLSQSNPGSQFSTHTLSQSNPGSQFSTHTLTQSNHGASSNTQPLNPHVESSIHALPNSNPGAVPATNSRNHLNAEIMSDIDLLAQFTHIVRPDTPEFTHTSGRPSSHTLTQTLNRIQMKGQTGGSLLLSEPIQRASADPSLSRSMSSPELLSRRNHGSERISPAPARNQVSQLLNDPNAVNQQHNELHATPVQGTNGRPQSERVMDAPGGMLGTNPIPAQGLGAISGPIPPNSMRDILAQIKLTSDHINATQQPPMRVNVMVSRNNSPQGTNATTMMPNLFPVERQPMLHVRPPKPSTVPMTQAPFAAEQWPEKMPILPTHAPQARAVLPEVGAAPSLTHVPSNHLNMQQQMHHSNTRQPADLTSNIWSLFGRIESLLNELKTAASDAKVTNVTGIGAMQVQTQADPTKVQFADPKASLKLIETRLEALGLPFLSDMAAKSSFQLPDSTNAPTSATLPYTKASPFVMHVTESPNAREQPIKGLRGRTIKRRFKGSPPGNAQRNPPQEPLTTVTAQPPVRQLPATTPLPIRQQNAFSLVGNPFHSLRLWNPIPDAQAGQPVQATWVRPTPSVMVTTTKPVPEIPILQGQVPNAMFVQNWFNPIGFAINEMLPMMGKTPPPVSASSNIYRELLFPSQFMGMNAPPGQTTGAEEYFLMPTTPATANRPAAQSVESARADSRVNVTGKPVMKPALPALDSLTALGQIWEPTVAPPPPQRTLRSSAPVIENPVMEHALPVWESNTVPPVRQPMWEPAAAAPPHQGSSVSHVPVHGLSAMEPSMSSWESNTVPPFRRPMMNPNVTPPPQKRAPDARVIGIQSTKALNNTNTINNTTNVDNKRTRTMNITQEKKVMGLAGQTLQPVIQNVPHIWETKTAAPVMQQIWEPTAAPLNPQGSPVSNVPIDGRSVMEPSLPNWESNTYQPMRRPMLTPTVTPLPQKRGPDARALDIQATKAFNNTNTDNKTTNFDSKRNRNISMTYEKRVIEPAGHQLGQPAGQPAGQPLGQPAGHSLDKPLVQPIGQQFGHPMILNIMNPIHPAFLTPPPPRAPALVFPEMNSTKMVEIIQVLEALKSLKLAMVPGVTTQSPAQLLHPLLEYFQGQQKPETDPKYRKCKYQLISFAYLL